jgi:protein-S-isoprenylcysteine O-methyltransferase Ste14
MKISNKMLFGYIIGGILVIILSPFVIYMASNVLDKLYKIELLQNDVFRWSIIVFLMISGFIFGIWSIVIQNIVGQGGPVEALNIEISPKTRNLVVTGPYKYSRNPMLFGTFLAYCAGAVFINSINAMLLVLLFILIMLLIIVKNEEKRLVKDFGKEYEEYRKRTSILFPWFNKKSDE